ncbi:unnamed protein product [Dovyalis caffra]|uniref:RanBP2-type domain-containing protein n=1 Tax=Dovyalis caffra TaxID=77055 RepID=A0AAV1RPG3_9ROSI|nr:unnamed protein product [Dovyalis caffra]
MGSRDKDQTTPHHQPLLSSLVVRPSVSDGGDGVGGGGRPGGSDYEPGEVRREPPSYSRSDRYSDDPVREVAAYLFKILGDGLHWVLISNLLSLAVFMGSVHLAALSYGLMWLWGIYNVRTISEDNWIKLVATKFCELFGHWCLLLVECLLVLLLLLKHVLTEVLGTYVWLGYGGYRLRAGSGSPVRRRDADRRYSSDFDNSGGPPRGRDFSNGRDRPLRGEGISRNNPNVRPREGDWICSDPSCGNLNFARREYCNNCKRPRYRPGGSPRRGYPGPPPPHAPPRRFPGPPLDLSPGRTMNGYRSPPRGWARDGPRDFGLGGPLPPRQGGRFSDHDMRRDRSDYPDDEYRGRNKFDRPMPMDWGHKDRGRDGLFNERKGFERRPPSPPLPPPSLPQRGRWGRDGRDRSRSPIRGALPPKEFRQDMYMDRGRDDRHPVGRDRMRHVY